MRWASQAVHRARLRLEEAGVAGRAARVAGHTLELPRRAGVARPRRRAAAARVVAPRGAVLVARGAAPRLAGALAEAPGLAVTADAAERQLVLAGGADVAAVRADRRLLRARAARLARASAAATTACMLFACGADVVAELASGLCQLILELVLVASGAGRCAAARGVRPCVTSGAALRAFGGLEAARRAALARASTDETASDEHGACGAVPIARCARRGAGARLVGADGAGVAAARAGGALVLAFLAFYAGGLPCLRLEAAGGT